MLKSQKRQLRKLKLRLENHLAITILSHRNLQKEKTLVNQGRVEEDLSKRKVNKKLKPL
jgi:hypothetical protein